MNIFGFFKQSLIFILLFIVVSELTNLLYIDQVMSHSFDFQMEKQFETRGNRARIWIAGDSHPRNAVFPGHLPDSFVIATSGENVAQTYYRLRHYLEVDGLEVDLVILPIDLHTFSSFRVDRFNDTEYWKKFINFYELGVRKKDVPRFLLKRFSAEFAYIGGLENTIDALKIVCNCNNSPKVIDGFLALNAHIYRDPEIDIILDERVKRHFIYNDYIDPEVVNDYLDTLALLKAHDVNVVMVRYPMMEEYYDAALTRMAVDEFYFEFEQLLTTHGYHYPILDYHDVFFTHPEFFSDVDHLNVNGAIQLTKILRQDLEDLGLLPLD